MAALDKFIGQKYYDCCDAIQQYADTHHKILVVLEEGVEHNIDVEPNRLNAWINSDGVVTRFTHG